MKASQVTEQNADLVLISFLIDPLNNYTWWEAENTRRVIDEYREALGQETDPAIVRAAELADWNRVMRSLRAIAKVMWP